MPRAIADKLRFYESVEAFLRSRGAVGATTPEIVMHTGEPYHVVSHALKQMKKEGRLTRWREGLSDSWVSTKAQEQANAAAAEVLSPVPVVPDLKIGIVKSTGHLRLVWKGLSIEIGVLEE